MNNDINLNGVNAIFNKISITDTYPNDTDIIGSLEKAASIHKEVRRRLQPYLRPGIKLIDIAKIIEMITYELSTQNKSINKGIGFPVGLSLNGCAAHFHPSPTDTTILTNSDIIKIDFGTEANGWIIDSAFTICFDQKFNNLLEAVKEATETGIKNAGIDVNICDWGCMIQEVMESNEIILDGVTCPIKSISNLGGHNIIKGIIHGGMFLPTTNMKSTFPSTYRFKEGVYAIETFGSTGSNIATELGESTLYRINPNTLNSINNLKLNSTKQLCNKIYSSFKTLPFTDRYVDLFNINNFKSHLNILTNNNLIHSYPPLCVGLKDYTAQYEHTVYIGENNKIIFSRGEDY